MLYSNIPGIDKPVSRLVLGTMWIDTKNLDDAFPVLDAFHAAGGNCLDTAHLYGDGDNERAVGQWINERGLRDEIVILGKGAHHSQDRKRVTPYDIQPQVRVRDFVAHCEYLAPRNLRMCLAHFNWKMGCSLSDEFNVAGPSKPTRMSTSLPSSALSRAADPKRASSTTPKRFARTGLCSLSTSMS